MRCIDLATAYCPDVPRSRESTPGKLHGVLLNAESEYELGSTLCGLAANKAEVYCHGGYMPRWDSLCKRCLANKQFFAEVQTWMHC